MLKLTQDGYRDSLTDDLNVAIGCDGCITCIHTPVSKLSTCKVDYTDQYLQALGRGQVTA